MTQIYNELSTTLIDCSLSFSLSSSIVDLLSTAQWKLAYWLCLSLHKLS